MNVERLKEVEQKKLNSGVGNTLDTACIMQMVAYIADEPWSDRPECACPILTTYAIRLNDQFNDEHRQKLKPFIPLLVGTRTFDPTRIKRKQLIMWRNVTATYPLLLDLFKLPDLANQLRAFKNTVEDMNSASTLLKQNKELIYKNANACAYANAYADAYAYAYAYADAYANAYANADANAYAYADAYAYDALRAKLVDVAIETLRMAIEIKE